MTPVTAKREKTAENNRRRAAGIPFFSAYRQGKINYTVFFAECQGKSIARKPPEPLAISGFSTLSTGKTDTPRRRKTTFCDDFEISVMQVLQFLADKIAVLSAFLPVYMLCKTYVSIHKLCNLHKGEKSQKSSNFVRKFSGGKPADKADFLTFGNIFGAFYLTVKKVLRSPRDRVSALRHLVLRWGFRSPPQLRTPRFPFSSPMSRRSSARYGFRFPPLSRTKRRGKGSGADTEGRLQYLAAGKPQRAAYVQARP